MTKNTILLDELKRVLAYSPDTGLFVWRVKTCRKVVPGVVVGYTRPDGYSVVSVNKGRYRASRLAWFYMTGEWPKNDIDHIDGNPQNNAFYNLRDVSTSGNIQNQSRAHARNKTGGFLGVSKIKGCKRWRARICTNGVQTFIGWFNTPEEAHQAYLEIKRKVHSTCTI